MTSAARVAQTTDTVRIGTSREGFQGTPKLAALANGNYVAVWEDVVFGEPLRVRAQVYTPTGSRVGAEAIFQPAQFSGTSNLDVAALDGGGFIISFGNGAISGQRFDDRAVAVGEQLQLVGTPLGSDLFFEGRLASLADGGFALTFTDYDNYYIKMQRFDASGAAVGGLTTVNPDSVGLKFSPAVAGIGSGSVVTWINQNTSAIMLRRYDAAGDPVGAAQRVDAATGGSVGLNRVTALDDGGFIVTWLDDRRPIDFSPIAVVRAQRFDAAGNAVGPVMAITDADAFSYSPTVAGLAGGGFVVNWSQSTETGNVGRAQSFDALGQPVGEAFTFSAAAGNVGVAEVVGLSGGRFVIGWSAPGQPNDPGDIVSQGFIRYTAPRLALAGGDVAENSAVGSVVGQLGAPGVAGTLRFTLTGDANDRFMIDAATGVITVRDGTRLDYEAFATHMIKARVTANGRLVAEEFFTINLIDLDDVRTFTGTSAADTYYAAAGAAYRLVGNAGNDELIGAERDDDISGGAGRDTLAGGEGNDLIAGGSGNDTLYGNEGDDRFLVLRGAGFDYIYGGDGFDTVIAGEDGTVIAAIAFGSPALYEIERVDGGGFAGVTLAGSTASDLIDLSSIELVGIARITGGAGKDTIIGSAGDDIIVGGSGIDQLTGMAGRDTYRGTAAELRGDQLFFEFNDAIEITNFLTPSTTTFRTTDFGSVLYVDPDGPGGIAELKLLLGNGFDTAGFVAMAAEGGGTRIEYFG